MNIKFQLLVILLLVQPAARAEIPLDTLTLIQALKLDNTLEIEPSGLASCDDQLLMVSDKHDQLIYSLDVQNDKAHIRAFRNLDKLPANPYNTIPWTQKIKLWLINTITGNYLDWEGITCDDSNNLYLLSESTVSVLKISPDGELSWLNNSLYDEGSAAGVFLKTYGEGLTWSHDNQIFIAAERQPRGLIQTTLLNGELITQRIAVLDNTSLPQPTEHQRATDFTGLMMVHNHLFTLERNHSALCQRTIPSFEATHCWSYAHIENAPEFRYEDNQYGLAEGMVLHQNKLYLVFDNNQQKNTANADNSPLLLEFMVPGSFYTTPSNTN